MSMAYTLIYFNVQIRGSALHCQQQIMIIIITFLFGLAPLDHPVQDLSIYNVTHTQRVIRVSINDRDNGDKSAVSRYLYGGGR